MRRVAIIAVALATGALIAAQQADQAAAGEKIYFDKCAGCHGADLTGVERAPALAGSAFLDSWRGRDLSQLRARIDTMPPGAPKSLSDADAAAVMARWTSIETRAKRVAP